MAGKRPLDLPIYLDNYNAPVSGRTQIHSQKQEASLHSPKFRSILVERKELQNYENYCSKISNQHFCSSIQI